MAKSHRRNQQQTDTESALQVTSEYVAAMAARDSGRMDSLRSPDFGLDFVHTDAFESGPLSAQDAQRFWPVWFAAFPEMDYHVTRTIVAEKVIVMQWVFTGANTGPLEPPVFERHIEPTGRTIRFRGVSIYDVSDGLIQREAIYLDFATILVELGVEW